MNMTTVPSNQLKAMQQEIADLKEKVALLSRRATKSMQIENVKLREQSMQFAIDLEKDRNRVITLKEQVNALEDKAVILRATIKAQEHWQEQVVKQAAENDKLKETIAQQAEQIAGLVATNATLDVEWKKTTADKFAEQAEAIRVSVELMQEVESKYFALLKEKDTESDQFKAGGDMYGWNFHQGMRSGAVNMHIYMTKLIKHLATQPSPEILQDRDKRVAEACAKVCIEQSEGIARSTPVSRDCSESSVRESALRIRNGAWERHL